MSHVKGAARHPHLSSVKYVRPVHHLVGASEIATLLGVTRQRVHQLSKEPGFPEPVAQLGLGSVWDTEDVQQWAEQHRPRRRPAQD